MTYNQLNQLIHRNYTPIDTDMDIDTVCDEFKVLEVKSEPLETFNDLVNYLYLQEPNIVVNLIQISKSDTYYFGQTHFSHIYDNKFIDSITNYNNNKKRFNIQIKKCSSVHYYYDCVYLLYITYC
jgi:hypothetical protein